MVPPTLRLPLLSMLVSPIIAPVWAAEVITGSSLVPMTVIVTGWVELTPLLSGPVTLEVMVGCGRGARKAGASAAPRVKTIKPDPDPVLSAVGAESAPARTASIPLGGVAPDQVVDTTLVLTVW